MTKALWISDKYNLHRFEWVQNSYSLLNRGDEREILPLCADQGLGYTPFSPLAGGWLTGKYQSASDFPAGSRMTLRPEPYLRFLNEATFPGLAAVQGAGRAARRQHERVGAGVVDEQSARDRADHRAAQAGAPRPGARGADAQPDGGGTRRTDGVISGIVSVPHH